MVLGKSVVSYSLVKLFLSQMWMIPRLPLRDLTVVSEPMIRRRVELAPCIKSLPNKGGQTACPVEQRQRRYKCSVAVRASA
ncbi:hypothetical protein L195_g045231 [Trifolium pratense]|uniref:Uncharacterized protein n=1 Tax=Trifolium pratense TaxID=57577 RepID=A0A2K3MEA1_TRIPR|nr:hypothetical protein L195_g045231 [Trifolium pratense]